MPDRRVVAAFDVDGTLTRRDTLRPFLQLAFGRGEVARALLRHAPLARERDRYKAAVLRSLFAGHAVAPLQQLAERFAATVVPAGLRPGAAACIAEHRRRGHDVVLVSASLALYLEPIGSRVGDIDAILSTRLAVGDGAFTGELDGANCRGPAKVAALAAWLSARGLARDAVTVAAYGDSAGDRELLAFADIPTRVRSSADLRVPEPA
jgi:phosphatidylglycerophosphatase C